MERLEFFEQSQKVLRNFQKKSKCLLLHRTQLRPEEEDEKKRRKKERGVVDNDMSYEMWNHNMKGSKYLKSTR